MELNKEMRLQRGPLDTAEKKKILGRQQSLYKLCCLKKQKNYIQTQELLIFCFNKNNFYVFAMKHFLQMLFYRL